MIEENVSNIDKTQMIESFRQRLLGDYGYKEEQIGMDVEHSKDFCVDLAIWKNVDDKKNKILYSNIWQMQDTGETKLNAEKNKYFNLFIDCFVSIYMPPKEKRKCVRIRAIDGITQETFDLGKILKGTDYKA